MVDPITAGLAIYKYGKLAIKANDLYGRFENKTTETFIAARNDMFQEWTAETSRRVDEHVQESGSKFVELGGTIEEHAQKLEHLLDQQETQVLAVLYAEASYREALAERRRMLSFAAASIVDLNLSIEDKASTERVIRSLDPVDVLELHGLSRAVGKFERVGKNQANTYKSTSAMRHALLVKSPCHDALCATRCVRERYTPRGGGGWGGAGVEVDEAADVTDRGALILRVLAKFIDEKHGPFVGCGREELQGSRSDVDAAKTLAAIPGLKAALRAALDGVAAAERSHSRPWFEHPEPQIAMGDARFPRDFDELDPRAESSLIFGAVPPDLARVVPHPLEGEIRVVFEDLPQYGRPATNVRITGPFDILRWLADDFDAQWT